MLDTVLRGGEMPVIETDVARKEVSMACHMTEIKQVGFAVPDIQKSIEAFSAIGLADWSPVTEVSPEGFEGMICDGEPKEYAFLCATNNELDIEIELIQPLDDNSDYAHFIAQMGGRPALHHLSVETDDVEALEQSGHKLLIAGNQKGLPLGWRYYDFRDDLGTVLEYFPMPVEE